MNKLISVIVPVYNVEKYLQKCVDSIINQTYQNLEIILVDDGSTDNSGKICDEYLKKDKRIKVIHKRNGGLSDARNWAIDVAEGEYIEFVDSDDYIEQDMIEFLYNNIEQYNADISICSYYMIDEKECINQSTNELYVYSRLEILQEVLLDEKIRSYAWNKLFKKSLFDDIRFPVGKIFEDVITIGKLFEKSEKVVLNDVAKYYYRQREGSILHIQNSKTRLAYIYGALEILKYLKEKEEKLELYCVYNYAHITIKTYNDIGLFDMQELVNESVIIELYEKTCEIFKNKEYEKFIIEKSSNVKKLHYYYLLTDKDDYLAKNKSLPLIYPGWGPK